jgi:hypothetical protein
MLFPYNEGALVEDLDQRQATGFRYQEPLYPSLGCYAMFPNMIASQFMAYVSESGGVYLGAHDERRGVKAVDFCPDEEKNVCLRLRIYCDTARDGRYELGFPLVLSTFDGGWEDAADRYRAWFEQHLPAGACKQKDNKLLPSWYADAPLVLSWCVRGVHDMDEMSPNKLFPYGNALPLVEELAARTGSRILALLMHWEGSAPWAPPYVWPPYGGEESFRAFQDSLHARATCWASIARASGTRSRAI